MFAKLLNLLLLLLITASIIGAMTAISAIAQESRIVGNHKIVIRNDFGDISITGWERNTVEAAATNVTRAEAVPVSITEDSADAKKIIVALNPQSGRNANGKIILQVKVPRNAELEPFSVGINSISLNNIKGTFNVETKSGDITAENIEGELTVKTGNGNVKINGVSRLVDITTGNGNIDVQNVKHDVRVAAINGKIKIQCVEGAVEIRDTSSQTMLLNIGGDIDATTSNGKVNFIGAVRSDNRYRLKTLSGVVSMLIPADVGFTATMSSYSGQIEKDFNFDYVFTFRSGKTNQRFVGKYGDGKVRIELDSFDGRVRLGKISAEAIQKCSEVKTND
jgi:DUF4097 and DUF4098 domain-containing protein YvlB